MRHYTWNGSGGSIGAEKKEVIPNAGNGADIPIGTGMQPKDYDKSNNLYANPATTTFGASEERVQLTNAPDNLAIKREVKKGDRVATLMPKTGVKQ